MKFPVCQSATQAALAIAFLIALVGGMAWGPAASLAAAPDPLFLDEHWRTREYLRLTGAPKVDYARNYLAQFEDDSMSAEELVAAIEPTPRNFAWAREHELGSGAPLEDLVAGILLALEEAPWEQAGEPEGQHPVWLAFDNWHESPLLPSRDSMGRLEYERISRFKDIITARTGGTTIPAARHAAGFIRPLDESELAAVRQELEEHLEDFRDPDIAHDTLGLYFTFQIVLNQTGEAPDLGTLLADQETAQSLSTVLRSIRKPCAASRFVMQEFDRFLFRANLALPIPETMRSYLDTMDQFRDILRAYRGFPEREALFRKMSEMPRDWNPMPPDIRGPVHRPLRATRYRDTFVGLALENADDPTHAEGLLLLAERDALADRFHLIDQIIDPGHPPDGRP